MANLGACCVVLRGRDILLTQREDYEVWCLPGGGIEVGESAVQGAEREVQEETGLRVRATRLVGLWSQPERGGHVAVFAAEPLDGALRTLAGETIAVDWFSADALPDPLVWWHRAMIDETLSGIAGAVWTSHIRWSLPDHVRTRADQYAYRDASGLTRQEFFRRHLDVPRDEHRDLPGA